MQVVLDEQLVVEENGFPPLIEIEEDMPVSDKQFNELNIRVAQIEGSLTAIKWMVGLLFPTLAALTIGFAVDASHQGERIAHLEGEKGDILGATVRSIEAPASRQQLDANLAFVTAQLRLDRVQGKKPNPQKLAKIANAVQTASSANPDDVDVWRAASELVSYRSALLPISLPEALPNCLDVVESEQNWRDRYTSPEQGKVTETKPGYLLNAPAKIPWRPMQLSKIASSI
jgi:hypothetical protein